MLSSNGDRKPRAKARPHLEGLKQEIARRAAIPRRRLRIPAEALQDKERLAEHLARLNRKRRDPIRLLPEQWARVDRTRRRALRKRRLHEILSTLCSVAIHFMAWGVLAWTFFRQAVPEPRVDVRIAMAPEVRAPEIPVEAPGPIDGIPDEEVPDAPPAIDPWMEAASVEIADARPEEVSFEFEVPPAPILQPIVPAQESPPLMGVSASAPSRASHAPLAARTDAARGSALHAGGGNAASENAVDLGLTWLAAHQEYSGAWSPSRYARRCPSGAACAGEAGSGAEEHGAGVTGLALLAFLGRGNTHRSGPHADSVRRASEYLLGIQDGTGAFRPGGRAARGEMYSQGICTLALAELYAVTGDERIGGAARRGLDAVLRSQQSGGGWDYGIDAPTGRDDLSVSGWQMMAIKSSMAAGIPVPADRLLSVLRYLRRAELPGGRMQYADQSPGTGDSTPGVTAAGMAGKLFLGWDPATEALRDGRRYLRNQPPRWDAGQMFYTWYYATLALYQAGGEDWSAWNPPMRDLLVARQCSAGHAVGSWDPQGGDGAYAGRVYSTAMAVLTLEVYYRYVPGAQEGGNLEPVVQAVLQAPPEVQLRARDTLRPLGDRALQVYAERLAGSSDPQIRAGIAALRFAAGDASAGEDLAALLAAGTEPTLRLRAARTLVGGAHAQDARACLRELLQDANPVIRFGALQALGVARDRDSVPALIPLLRDPEEYIAVEASRTLVALTGEGYDRDVTGWLAWWEGGGGGLRRLVEEMPARAGDHAVAVAAVGAGAQRRLEEEIGRAVRDDAPDLDLLRMLVWAEQSVHPGLDAVAIERRIDAWAADLQSVLGSRRDPAAVEAALREVLFRRGALRDSSPDRPGGHPVFLGEVIEAGAGNCVGLSALAACVAERAGIPVYGCRYPGHFFLELPAARGPGVYFEGTAGGVAMSRDGYERAWEPNPVSRDVPLYFRREGDRALLAEVINIRAQRLREGGDLAGALRDTGLSVALDPQWPVHRANRGGVLVCLGRLDEARTEYARALAADPGYAPAYAGRAALSLRAGDPDAALSDLEEAFRLGSPRPDWFLTRAAARQLTSRAQDALWDYGRAIEAGAGVEARLLRAVLLEELGRPEEALIDLRRAREVAPGHDGVAYQLGRMLAARPDAASRREARDLAREILARDGSHAGARGLLASLGDVGE